MNGKNYEWGHALYSGLAVKNEGFPLLLVSVRRYSRGSGQLGEMAKQERWRKFFFSF